MGVIYTGMQRATELTINKTVGGSSISGYPRIYRLGDAFGTYSTMTNQELAEAKTEDYRARLAAFKTYVESIEIGIPIDLSEAYRENLTACPI
jgi:hypothetical protein|nr:MAG TPA: hypothetical protein [Caudoviricetes sp.]